MPELLFFGEVTEERQLLPVFASNDFVCGDLLEVLLEHPDSLMAERGRSECVGACELRWKVITYAMSESEVVVEELVQVFYKKVKVGNFKKGEKEGGW